MVLDYSFASSSSSQHAGTTTGIRMKRSLIIYNVTFIYTQLELRFHSLHFYAVNDIDI